MQLDDLFRILDLWLYNADRHITYGKGRHYICPFLYSLYKELLLTETPTPPPRKIKKIDGIEFSYF